MQKNYTKYLNHIMANNIYLFVYLFIYLLEDYLLNFNNNILLY